MGAGIAFLENFDPPVDRPSRIDQEMKNSQHDSSRPAQRQSEQDPVDEGMDPTCRVAKVGLMHRHPVVLQEPIGGQVGHESLFEEGH